MSEMETPKEGIDEEDEKINGSGNVAEQDSSSKAEDVGDTISDDEGGEEEEGEEEDEEVTNIQPLATTRSRRSNAGNRMSNLIQEEEDEFYTNIYGGFNDEEDDDDFDDEEEAENEDVENDYDVDSDFSIDETDEILPEHQTIDEEPKKKRGVYKDPKPKVPTGGQASFTSTPVQVKPKPGPSTTNSSLSPSKHRPERTFRDSTKKKTAETIKNIETGSKRKKKHRNHEAPRKLTQEEMLEEAKITEEENIKSLEIYQRLESEKLKKIKLAKKTLPIPYVTLYSSVFKNPKDGERYSRNLMTYVGCEPSQAKK